MAQFMASYRYASAISAPILLMIYSILVTPDPADAAQRIVEHPQNITARMNETVILRCRVEDQKGTLQWVKNGFGLGASRELPLLDRYTMVGKLGMGEYHLQIANATFADDDTYECQLSPTDSEPMVISQVARLSIIAEPSEPITLLGVGDVVTATEGVAVHLACRVGKGRPAAAMQWVVTADHEADRVLGRIVNETRTNARHKLKVRDHSLHARYGQIHEEIEVDPFGFSTITSNLSFTPTKAENGKFVACMATHASFGNVSRVASVPFDVLYSPKPQVELDESESSVVEGGRLVFRCHVDAKPLDDVTVRWSWEGDERRLATMAQQQTAMITAMKIEDNGARVTCTATNSIGTESASVKLDIPYGPRFMSTNQTKLVQRGDSSTLQCEVLGNPQPEVLWYHNDKEEFIAMGKNYTISNVQEWEAGEYKCTATVKGFPPKSLSHQIHIKGPPAVYLSEYLLEGGDGDVTLTCEVRSKSLPLKVLWLHKGVPLDYNRAHSRYQLQELKRDWGTESKMTIRNFNPVDHGLYNCTASNDYGTSHHHQEIYRRNIWEQIKRSTEQLSLPMQLALAIAFVVFMLCVLLACCLKCSQRCCHGRSSKSSSFGHDSGDVIVKCEAIDGAQFYPELYGSPRVEMSDVTGGKDYMSVPQSNPDLDFLAANPSLNFANGGAIAYGPAAAGTYLPPFSHQQQYNSTYESFVNPQGYFPNAGDNAGGAMQAYSTANGNLDYCDGPYNGQQQYLTRPNQMGMQAMGGGGAMLETLPEVSTPDSERGGLAVAMHGMPHERSVSRISTHV